MAAVNSDSIPKPYFVWRIVVKQALAYLFPLAIMLWPATGQTGSWRQVNQSGFGTPNNVEVYCLASYDRRLYAGTAGLPGGGEAWQYDGIRWRRIADAGFGDENNGAIISMAVFGAHLYAATTNTTTGTQVWRYDGSTWAQVNVDGFGDRDNLSTPALSTHNNRLYAGTLNYTTGTQIWEYNGTSWNRVNEDGFRDSDNKLTRSMTEYHGFLYAGTSNSAGTQIWRYEGGVTWTLTNTSGFRDTGNRISLTMTTFSGRLLVGTSNNVTGAEVWAYDGTSWTQANIDGFGDPTHQQAMSMAVYGGQLYVGSKNGLDEAILLNYDGTSWSEARPASFGTGFVRAMAVHDEKLYAATDGPGGATLWEYTTATLSQVNLDGFGSEDNHTVLDLEVFDERLFASIQNGSSSDIYNVEIWEYRGANWINIRPSDATFGILGSMAAFDGRLYVAANTLSPLSFIVAYDGSSWINLETGQFGDSENLGITSMAVYEGRLYCCVLNWTTGVEVWRFDGATWSQVNADGFGDPNNRAGFDMIVHGGYLHVSAMNSQTGVEIWQYDGTNWRQVNDDGFGLGRSLPTARLCSYRDDLYSGYYRELYRFDGTSWVSVDLTPVGVGATRGLTAMGVYQRNLYFGTLDRMAGAQLWAYNGSTWTQITNGSAPFSRAIFPVVMAVHDNRLFIGSGSPPSSGVTLELPGSDPADDGSIIDPEGGIARVWAFHDPGPELVLRANGVEGTLTVTEGTAISLTAGISPGLQADHVSDWWFFCLTPFDAPYNFVSLTVSSGWLPGLRPLVQHPLFEVTPPAEIFNLPLPAGEYTCAFIIDGNDDGLIDYHWWRTVNMKVLP
jgi:hypothetical protein